jgi:hypothetical protein
MCVFHAEEPTGHVEYDYLNVNIVLVFWNLLSLCRGNGDAGNRVLASTAYMGGIRASMRIAEVLLPNS